MRESSVLIFGKPETGKTERMLYELRNEARVVLVDPKCSQLMHLKRWDHLETKFDEEIGKWTDYALAAYLSYFRRLTPFRVVVHLRTWHRGQLNMLCRLLLAVKNCVLAVDELGLFVPPGPAGALPSNITAVVVSGTHDGLHFIGTAQRPSLVHATIRANASRMLFYRMTEKADVKLIENYLPEHLHSRVESLPNYVCLDWADRGFPFEDRTLVGKLHELSGSRT